MLEKLSNSSVSFIMKTLERPHCILSYTHSFKVLFATLESLTKKVTIHSYTLQTKISFYLKEN